jgi:hypothetical protein
VAVGQRWRAHRREVLSIGRHFQSDEEQRRHEKCIPSLSPLQKLYREPQQLLPGSEAEILCVPELESAPDAPEADERSDAKQLLSAVKGHSLI